MFILRIFLRAMEEPQYLPPPDVRRHCLIPTLFERQTKSKLLCSAHAWKDNFPILWTLPLKCARSLKLSTLPAAKNITPAHYSAASPSHWRVFLADCPSVLSNTNSLGLAFNSSLKVKQQAGSTALKCIQNFQVMGQHLKNTFIPWQEPTPLLVHNKGGITGTQEQHRLSTCQLWANKASPPAWEQHPEQQHPEQHQGPLQGQQEPVSRSCRKPAMSKVCPAIETPND